MWVAGGLQVFVIAKDISIDSLFILQQARCKRSINANAAVIVHSLTLRLD